MKIHANALKIGTRLDEYEIKSILGSGGFGITYLAYDVNLLMHVVIKEYLPSYLALRKSQTEIIPISKNEEEEFKWGMKRFLEEAQTLASFKPRHPNIVKVIRFFKKNNTAYFVMEHEDGEDLSSYLKRTSDKMSEKEIKNIILPILSGLKETHEKNILHRDIKPSNIFLRSDKTPLLIDFGSARHAIGNKTKSLSVVVTPGYAPIEQYTSTAKQGAFTDIYSIGAVMYKLATNEAPIEANDRSMSVYTNGEKDLLVLAKEKARGEYSYGFLDSIDKALSIRPQDRPQSIEQLQKLLMDTSNDENTIKESFTRKYKPQRKRKYNKKLFIVIGFILAVLIGSGFYINNQLNLAKQEKIKAKQLEDKKREEKIRKEKEELALLQKEEQKQEKLKQERLEQERLEQERLEQEKKEQERLDQEKLEEEKKKVTTDKYAETSTNKKTTSKSKNNKKNKKKSKNILLCYKYNEQAKSFNYCKKACDENDGTSCTNLGFLYNRGEGVDINYKKAISLHTKACNLGSSLGCSNLGYMYDNARGVKKNTKKAFSLYKKACSMGSGLGCSNLARMYFYGRGVKKSISKTRRYYKKSCNLGYWDGCKSYERHKPTWLERNLPERKDIAKLWPF